MPQMFPMNWAFISLFVMIFMLTELNIFLSNKISTESTKKIKNTNLKWTW